MNQIRPHALWIGHAGDGRAYREVFAAGIRAVVQLATEDPPLQPPRELLYVRVPLLDGGGNEIDLLAFAIDAVAGLIERRIATLVCCGMGMSRSPAIVAAALALASGSDVVECLRGVVGQHPADVSPGLWADVRAAVAARRKCGPFQGVPS